MISFMQAPGPEARAGHSASQRQPRADDHGDAHEDRTAEAGRAEEQARERRAAAEKDLEKWEANKAGITQYFEVELDRKSVHMTHEGIAAQAGLPFAPLAPADLAP